MSRFKVFILVAFAQLSILSCDGCKNRGSEEPFNFVFAIHGRGGDVRNFEEMFSIINRELLKLPEDRMIKILEANWFLPLFSRQKLTRELPMAEQVKLSEEEIKQVLSTIPDEFKNRKKNIYFIGHSQGGVIAEELTKLLSADLTFIKENRIDVDNFKIFTLGAPIMGIDGNSGKIEELNVYLKKVFRDNKNLNDYINAFSVEAKGQDPFKIVDQWFDLWFNENELPSSSKDPGLIDLSRAKQGGATPPSCKVCYGVGEIGGFEVLIRDHLAPAISGLGLRGNQVESELRALFTDTEKAHVNRFWVETLDNGPNDGQVPVESQFRAGALAKRYNMTHCELLSSPQVTSDILDFFGIEIK